MCAGASSAIVAAMSAVTDPLAAFESLAGRRVLVVGCRGPDVLAAALRRGAAVWGVDDSSTRLAAARDRVLGADLRLGRYDELPFDSASFDVVCGLWTHAAGAAGAELIRVCRPDGFVVLRGDGESPGPPECDSSY
jgi:SAM-dependent methyltransferase